MVTSSLMTKIYQKLTLNPSKNASNINLKSTKKLIFNSILMVTSSLQKMDSKLTRNSSKIQIENGLVTSSLQKMDSKIDQKIDPKIQLEIGAIGFRMVTSRGSVAIVTPSTSHLLLIICNEKWPTSSSY